MFGAGIGEQQLIRGLRFTCRFPQFILFHLSHEVCHTLGSLKKTHWVLDGYFR